MTRFGLGLAVGVMTLACASAHPSASFVESPIKPKTSDTRLVLTARSARVGGQEIKIGIPPLTVWLVAEVKGPPAEKLYCPQIVWLYPNGTEDSEESECADWESTQEFPRRWAKGLILGNAMRDPYTFVVEARRGNVVIARAEAKVLVVGDVGGALAQ